MPRSGPSPMPNELPHTIAMNNVLLPVLATLLVALAACGGADNAPPPAASAEQHAAETHTEPGHDPESRVELNAPQLAAAGIAIAAAGSAPIHETLSLYGAIEPNAERVLEVTARFPGVIRRVTKKIGDPVTPGETLALVESDESLQTYAVSAPLGGIVTARNANPGEQSGSRALFTVADLSTVWVELSLFPRDLARVRTGQRVRVKSSDGALSGEGVLVYVAPIGRSTQQSLSARVLLDNPQRNWAPGLYVSAEVVLGANVAPLAVRNSALQMQDGKVIVFVQHADGDFEARPLRLGRSDDEYSEVLDGLAAGERYASDNSFVLLSQQGAAGAEHGH